jgi:hypothetical protein
MFRISLFAPDIAAISSDLNRFVNYSQQPPTLGLAPGTALRYLNKVSQTTLIVFVVHAKLCPPSDILAVLGVLDFIVNRHSHAFITTPANNHTGQSF